ncbi:hypothetical protein N665_8458s0001 [Sinapis alba]|nr:hypothetical protein N665_8458s0001 [Sinapis alba]
MSHKVRSSASKQYLLIIGASSQTISDALDITSALSLPAVLPPGSNKEAMPLDATFSTISPVDRIAADRIFHKKVFPVPPKPYTKKTPPFLLSTTSIIWSYTDLCSSVNLPSHS